MIPPWELPAVTFCRYFPGSKRNLSDSEIRSIFLDHKDEQKNSLSIFTDGSKSNAGVGFGVFSEEFSRKGALPGIASNFTAELTGILSAVKTIATLQGNARNFTIFCDSKSVLQSIESFNSKHPIIFKNLEWLFLIQKRGKIINFCWVPAHVDITGNERADRLAKEAAVNSIPRPYPIPSSDFIPAIAKEIRELWQFCWDLELNNKMREITTSAHPWLYAHMPRKLEVILCCLRIGHSRLTHGCLMSGNYQPFCQDCVVPLTVRHILIRCPSFEDARCRHLPIRQAGEDSLTLEKILDKDCSHFKLLDFLEEVGLLSNI